MVWWFALLRETRRSSGTHTGDILRNEALMKADLPRYNCDLETIGNDDRKVWAEINATWRSWPWSRRLPRGCLPNYPLHCIRRQDSFQKVPTFKQEFYLFIDPAPRWVGVYENVVCSARVSHMSYSRWEGRKNAPLYFPSSSNPSMKAYGMEWQAEIGGGWTVNRRGWNGYWCLRPASAFDLSLNVGSHAASMRQKKTHIHSITIVAASGPPVWSGFAAA